MAKRTTNKMDAVRQALAELGSDAKPQALQEHLKAKGVSMSTNMISNYKTVIHKKAGKRGRRRGRKPGPRKVMAAAGARRGNSLTVADIQAVKKLTDRIGATRVKELVTVLGG